jgi:hypothetical protein
MVPCPEPPYWRPVKANEQPGITKAAEWALEQAYKEEKGDRAVLFGSQFELGTVGLTPPELRMLRFVTRSEQRELRLPPDVPNHEFGNELLAELRGEKFGPRKPDVVDFRERSFVSFRQVCLLREGL